MQTYLQIVVKYQNVRCKNMSSNYTLKRMNSRHRDRTP